jgi:hypothetical protein
MAGPQRHTGLRPAASGEHDSAPRGFPAGKQAGIAHCRACIPIHSRVLAIIFELFPSGEIRSFEAETGKFVVNPNALFSDGKHLFAGTLEGVKILDLRSQKWKTVRRFLPSETVMSITADEENIYFATTGGLAKFKKNYFTDEETE